jgi:hypothetical protein
MNLVLNKIISSSEELDMYSTIKGNEEIIYFLDNNSDFNLLKNKKFITDKNEQITTNENGKVISKTVIQTKKKYSSEEFLDISKPLFDEIQELISSSIKEIEIKISNLYNEKINSFKKTKILFTLLSLDTGQKFYLGAAKRLTNEILNQTTHDVIISTNDVSFFSDINSSRCLIRDNIKKESVLKYGSEFNYNLKHHAFLDLPKKYDYIIYLDCDIKLNSWTQESDLFMETQMINYDFGADRLNCHLKDEVTHFLSGLNCLFSHKIKSYDLLERYYMTDDIMNSRLPSEHFLILKNDSDKIKKFQEKWEEQNLYLQDKKGIGGSWGDGFEIGISAKYAGFETMMEMSPYYWSEILGFKFNGNKF